MSRVLVVVTLFGGAACDAAFGLTGNELPECELASFAGVIPKSQSVTAHVFSFDEARARALIGRNGQQYEVDAMGEVVAQLGPASSMMSLSLTPEGNHAFYTAAASEIPGIALARRVSRGVWSDETPPKGAFAGTPTAATFGPRQMIVRLSAYPSPTTGEHIYQELREDPARGWVAIGERRTFPGTAFPPNLSADGLTIVYDALSTNRAEITVYAAQRTSVDDWFRDPVALLPAAPATATPRTSPQLSSNCKRLDVIGADLVVENTEPVILRYER